MKKFFCLAALNATITFLEVKAQFQYTIDYTVDDESNFEIFSFGSGNTEPAGAWAMDAKINMR